MLQIALKLSEGSWKGWPLLWNAWRIIPKDLQINVSVGIWEGWPLLLWLNWLKNHPKIVADWCECRDMGRVLGLIGAPARAKWPIRGSGFSLPAETFHHFFSQFSQQVFNKIVPKFNILSKSAGILTDVLRIATKYLNKTPTQLSLYVLLGKCYLSLLHKICQQKFSNISAPNKTNINWQEISGNF